MPQSIVVGYDGTAGAHAALKEASTLAADLGCRVHIVFAYDKVMIGGESRDLDEAVAARGRTVLAEALAVVTASGVEADTEIVEAGVAQALVDAADRVQARFIVVGSYGERPIKGALVGATPYKLMYLSDHAIVVVPVPEES